MSTSYAQLKFETAPGYEGSSDTLSTKTIYPPAVRFKLGLGPQHLIRDDEMRGTDDAVPVLAEMFNPTWECEVRMYPDLLGFFLKGLLGAPTTTAGNGSLTDPDTTVYPTGTYKHVWTAPYGPAGASPQTMQAVVAYKDQAVFWRVKGMATEKLSIESPESGGVRVKISGTATYAQRISDPSLSPSPEAIATRPFLRSGLQIVTWLSGSGTTEDYSTEITNPVENVRSLGVQSKFADVVEKGEGLIITMGSIPKRQLDVDDIDALIAATGFATKARWTCETVAASAYTHKFWQELSNAQYVDGDPDELQNKRRHGASFNFKATNNGSASQVLTLINATSSYA